MPVAFVVLSFPTYEKQTTSQTNISRRECSSLLTSKCQEIADIIVSSVIAFCEIFSLVKIAITKEKSGIERIHFLFFSPFLFVEFYIYFTFFRVMPCQKKMKEKCDDPIKLWTSTLKNVKGKVNIKGNKSKRNRNTKETKGNKNQRNA